MKKILSHLLLIGLIVFSTVVSALANTDSPSSKPAVAAASSDTGDVTAAYGDIVAAAPAIKAKAYVLMDVNSGKVLISKAAAARRAPASLTKLMTIYLTFQAIKNGSMTLDTKVPISKKAWQTGGSKTFVKVGTNVSVSDLVRGVIVQSGNDAAVALAQYIGGSENSFVSLMNKEAARLGMTGTHYTDPTGLPNKDHYSTAHDLALLARALIIDFPQDYHFFGEKWFTYSNIRQPNRNRLLWRFKGADGLKTGHTKEAGYCLISSAKRDDMRLLAVVLGASGEEERNTDSMALLGYGFRFFKTARLYAGKQAIEQLAVSHGKRGEVAIGVSRDWFVTLPRMQFNRAKVTLRVNPTVTAPIKAGQKLGEASVQFNGKTVTTVPLVALTNVARAGGLARFGQSMRNTFKSWFGKTKQPVERTFPIAQTGSASSTQDDGDANKKTPRAA